MNTIKLNIVSLNQIHLNLVGHKTMKGGTDGGSGDIPSGYAEIVSVDGKKFSAADGDFYVKL